MLLIESVGTIATGGWGGSKQHLGDRLLKMRLRPDREHCGVNALKQTTGWNALGGLKLPRSVWGHAHIYTTPTVVGWAAVEDIPLSL